MSLAASWRRAAAGAAIVLLAAAPAVAAPASAPPAAPAASAPAGAKVLRYAFLVAETGFDPAQINDLYSRIITSHIFDGLYKYDYLARPYKVVPNVAIGLPEVGDDFRTWTIQLRPGILFADDPAFKGKPRELVAQDYVYAF